MVEEQESHSPLQRPLTGVFYASALTLTIFQLEIIFDIIYAFQISIDNKKGLKQ
jgi:hypothetical protein